MSSFVVPPGEGSALDLPGWQMRVTVPAESTDHRLTVITGVLAPGHQGPAPHVHDGHDECFVVLRGSMQFRVGAEVATAGAGATVLAPRGQAHGFANPFDEPASYVVLLTPSGYEGYFALVAAYVAQHGAMPGTDWVASTMSQFGTRLAP